MLLEQIFITQGQLLQKEYNKYDLDSPEGQKICKKYLHLIEKLCEVSFNLRVLFGASYLEGLPQFVQQSLQDPLQGLQFMLFNRNTGQCSGRYSFSSKASPISGSMERNTSSPLMCSRLGPNSSITSLNCSTSSAMPTARPARTARPFPPTSLRRKSLSFWRISTILGPNSNSSM